MVADKIGWEALPPEFTDAQYAHLICRGGDSSCCSTYTVPFMDFLQSLDGLRRRTASAMTVTSPSDAVIAPQLTAIGSDIFRWSRTGVRAAIGASQDRLIGGSRRDSSPTSGKRPSSYRGRWYLLCDRWLVVLDAMCSLRSGVEAGADDEDEAWR